MGLQEPASILHCVNYLSCHMISPSKFSLNNVPDPRLQENILAITLTRNQSGGQQATSATVHLPQISNPKSQNMSPFKLNLQVLHQLGKLFRDALLASWSSLVLPLTNFIHDILISLANLLLSLANNFYYFTRMTEISFAPNGTIQFRTDHRLAVYLVALTAALFILTQGGPPNLDKIPAILNTIPAILNPIWDSFLSAMVYKIAAKILAFTIAIAALSVSASDMTKLLIAGMFLAIVSVNHFSIYAKA